MTLCEFSKHRTLLKCSKRTRARVCLLTALEINSFHSEAHSTLNVCTRKECYLESAILTVLGKGLQVRNSISQGFLFFHLFVLKKTIGKFAQKIRQNSSCSIFFILKQHF